MFSQRAKGKCGGIFANNWKGKRSRTAFGGGQEQQGNRDNSGNRLQDSRDAPSEPDAQAQLSFGHRDSPLRYPQSSSGGLASMSGRTSKVARLKSNGQPDLPSYCS